MPARPRRELGRRPPTPASVEPGLHAELPPDVSGSLARTRAHVRTREVTVQARPTPANGQRAGETRVPRGQRAGETRVLSRARARDA